jgi:hypothetical protein
MFSSVSLKDYKAPPSSFCFRSALTRIHPFNSAPYPFKKGNSEVTVDNTAVSVSMNALDLIQ